MLNPFPIQFLSLLAYFLLRIGVGSILMYFGFVRFRNRKQADAMFAGSASFIFWMVLLAELIGGALFILGLYTQIAALVTMAYAGIRLFFHRRFASAYFESRMFYMLLFFVSLSLFITGAGAFAFDLPI